MNKEIYNADVGRYIVSKWIIHELPEGSAAYRTTFISPESPRLRYLTISFDGYAAIS